MQIVLVEEDGMVRYVTTVDRQFPPMVWKMPKPTRNTTYKTPTSPAYEQEEWERNVKLSSFYKHMFGYGDDVSVYTRKEEPEIASYEYLDNGRWYPAIPHTNVQEELDELETSPIPKDAQLAMGFSKIWRKVRK